MRRIFYDAEFLDTGSTIDLISIGMVDEDGRICTMPAQAPSARPEGHYRRVPQPRKKAA